MKKVLCDFLGAGLLFIAHLAIAIGLSRWFGVPLETTLLITLLGVVTYTRWQQHAEK